MPDASRPSDPVPRKRRTGLATSLVLVAIILGLVGLALIGGQSKTSTVTQALNNDKAFNAGATRTLLEEIHLHGPVLFPDLLHQQHGNIIYVQHQGDSQSAGWLAINARVKGAALNCTVVWKVPTQNFVDPCSHITYPADGKGLIHYQTKVISGIVQVNLNKIVK